MLKASKIRQSHETEPRRSQEDRPPLPPEAQRPAPGTVGGTVRIRCPHGRQKLTPSESASAAGRRAPHRPEVPRAVLRGVCGTRIRRLPSLPVWAPGSGSPGPPCPEPPSSSAPEAAGLPAGHGTPGKHHALATRVTRSDVRLSSRSRPSRGFPKDRPRCRHQNVAPLLAPT